MTYLGKLITPCLVNFSTFSYQDVAQLLLYNAKLKTAEWYFSVNRLGQVVAVLIVVLE